MWRGVIIPAWPAGTQDNLIPKNESNSKNSLSLEMSSPPLYLPRLWFFFSVLASICPVALRSQIRVIGVKGQRGI